LLAQPAALTVSVNRTVFVASIENIVTGRVILSDYGKKNLFSRSGAKARRGTQSLFEANHGIAAKACFEGVRALAIDS